MSIMVQIRNVPDDLHRLLKSRAALAGLSLSDYLLAEMRVIAKQPTLDDMRATLKTRMRTVSGETSAEAVRAERDGR